MVQILGMPQQQQRFANLGNGGGFDNGMNPPQHLHQSFSNQEFGLNNHLGKTSPVPSVSPSLRNSYSTGNHLSGSSSGWQNKDWQDGLRAVLPNVNFSFGNLQNSFQHHQHQGGPGLTENGRPASVNLQQFVREEQENAARRVQQGKHYLKICV